MTPLLCLSMKKNLLQVMSLAAYASETNYHLISYLVSKQARLNADFFKRVLVAFENIRFSLLFAAGDVSRGGTSATQQQKFHTDDAIKCLHNKSSSHGVPNTNLSNLTCLLVNFGKVLSSSANELQQNSNASSREDYIPQLLTVLLEILCVYI